MTYSTSFSNNLVRCALVLIAGLLLGGCAFFQERPEPTATLPPPVSDTPSPQVVNTVPVLWQLDTSTPAEQGYRFEWIRNAGLMQQSSVLSEPSWQFTPKSTGQYRVRVKLYSSNGLYRLSEWSEPLKIVAPLRIASLEADRPDPQAALSVPISWQARINGGVPPYNYQFELRENQQQRFVQQGQSPDWLWLPDKAGSYKVRVTVVDSRGNREQSDWSRRYRVLEPLQVTTPQPKNPAEQHPLRDRILWQSAATGGVGKKSFQFELEKRDEAFQMTESGRNPNWSWQATGPGFYRVRVLVTDQLNNQRQSGWSVWKEVRAPLTIDSLQPDMPSPQAALARPIRWRVKTSGGVGRLSYAFSLQQQGQTALVQDDVSASWRWLPRERGQFQLKVRVTDELGTSVESPWSAPYQVEKPLAPEALIAFLPLDNLSGKKIPAAKIAAAYQQQLEEQGLSFLGPERLEAFMHRHRMRYTGGLSTRLAEALREEEQVAAVIVTSLTSYADKGVPQLALSSRLVLCQELPRIAWIDALGITGGDNPGLLALKRVTQVDELIDRALKQLVTSLSGYLKSGRLSADRTVKPLPPNDYYRSSELLPPKPYKVAIVPFLNRYARRNAGFIVPLQLVSALHRQGNLEVFEPGLVREQLLNYRLIMRAGPSLAIAEVLSSATTLDADLVLSGYIFDYQDDVGNPKIDFSTRLFAGKQRQIVWWSRGYDSGSDGVFFYDFGRIRSAQVMMARMGTAISELLFEPQPSVSANWPGADQALH